MSQNVNDEIELFCHQIFPKPFPNDSVCCVFVFDGVFASGTARPFSLIQCVASSTVSRHRGLVSQAKSHLVSQAKSRDSASSVPCPPPPPPSPVSKGVQHYYDPDTRSTLGISGSVRPVPLFSDPIWRQEPWRASQHNISRVSFYGRTPPPVSSPCSPSSSSLSATSSSSSSSSG